MFTYVVRRLLYGIPVLVVWSFLIFTFVASSTDPLEAVRMRPDVNQDAIHQIEKEKHLKDPMVVRYGYWVKDALTNNFGTGVLDNRPILPDLERVLKNTLQLIVAAEILSILLGCGIGIVSAIRRYSFFDHSATTFSFVGIAIPVFWLALSLQILFTTLFVKFHVRIFYTSGLSSIDPATECTTGSTARNISRCRCSCSPRPTWRCTRASCAHRCSRSSMRTTYARRGRKAFAKDA